MQHIRAVFVFLIILLSCQVCQAREYIINAVPSIANYYERARSVNDFGQIVGESITQVINGSSTQNAFYYQNNDIYSLGTLGGKASTAYDINNFGIAAGWAADSFGKTQPVYWDLDGIHKLQTIIGKKAWAYSVNDNGLIAGVTDSSSGFKAALWLDENMQLLESLGGVISEALDINLNGIAVGRTTDRNNNQYGCLWNEAGLLTLGMLPGGSWTNAQAVNDYSQIVLQGNTYTSTGRTYLWDNNEIIDIGGLGGDETWGWGINNDGFIVGKATTVIGTYHAFVWDGEETIDLGTLGGYSSSAYSINKYGVIAGHAQDENGRWQAVTWTPVPEPTTIAGIVSFIPLYLVVSRKRIK